MPEKITFQRKPEFLSTAEIKRLNKKLDLYGICFAASFLAFSFSSVAVALTTIFPLIYFLDPQFRITGIIDAPTAISAAAISLCALGLSSFSAIKFDDLRKALKKKLSRNDEVLKNWKIYQQQIAQNLHANRAIRLESKPPYADPKQAVRDVKEIFSNLSAPVGTAPHQKWDRLRRFCYTRRIMRQSQSSIGLG